MKNLKIDTPLVQHEDGRIGMVINHTKVCDYLHVIEFKDKPTSTMLSWRTDEVKPWDGEINITNQQKRLL